MIVALAAALLATPAPAAAPAGSVAECEARVREDPEALDSYRCFWVLARQNRVAEATAALEALLARDPGNERARLFLARVEGDHGRDRAAQLYEEAAAGLEAAGDTEGELFARLGLALFFGRRGRLEDAEAQIAIAARLAEAAGDAELAAWVHTEQAWQAFRRGEYGRAWRGFKAVEAQVFPDGPLDLQEQCLSGLGGVALELGRVEASFSYTRRQADVCHRSGDYYDEARARGNLVLTAFRLGMEGKMEPERIAVLAREALQAAVAGGNRGSEARARLYLGDLGEGLEAREHYREGLAISRETKEVAGLVLGTRGLALSFAESEPRDPAQALRLADRALELARFSRFYTAIARLARARVSWQVGSRERAIEDSLSALEAIEAIRDLQPDGLARARVFSIWAFAYHRLAARLLSGGDPGPRDLELAFSVIERRRARVLLDELDAARASEAAHLSGPAAQSRQELLERISGVQRRLMSPALPDPERRGLVEELEQLELREASLRADFARDNPAYAALRLPEPTTLTELRGALGESEALLSYEIATRRNVDNRTTLGGSWLWVHTRRETRLYPMPDRHELSSKVSLFRGLIERRDGSEGEAAAQLYLTLLSAALAELPSQVRTLTVIPDAALHRLPFGALRARPDAGPLADRFHISTAPSATLWVRWRRTAAGGGAPAALVLADPALGSDATAARRAWTDVVGSPPGRLPHSRREARSVVRHLGARSHVLVGARATERAVKQAELSHFRIVHFATHALVDDDHPERSAILLAPGSDGEDGLLQIREIVDLDLRGHVVVLSACRTASGELLEGEGVMGLARAFFQAGARAVVGSLWPLRDDEAAQLIEPFYAALAQGQSLAGALALARRERIAANAPSAAWAGLVVLGDGAFLPRP